MNVVGKSCQVLYCGRGAVKHVGGKDLCSVCLNKWLSSIGKWERINDLPKKGKGKIGARIVLDTIHVPTDFFSFDSKGKFRNYMVVLNEE